MQPVAETPPTWQTALIAIMSATSVDILTAPLHVAYPHSLRHQWSVTDSLRRLAGFRGIKALWQPTHSLLFLRSTPITLQLVIYDRLVRPYCRPADESNIAVDVHRLNIPLSILSAGAAGAFGTAICYPVARALALASRSGPSAFPTPLDAVRAELSRSGVGGMFVGSLRPCLAAAVSRSLSLGVYVALVGRLEDAVVRAVMPSGSTHDAAAVTSSQLAGGDHTPPIVHRERNVTKVGSAMQVLAAALFALVCATVGRWCAERVTALAIRSDAARRKGRRFISGWGSRAVGDTSIHRKTLSRTMWRGVPAAITAFVFERAVKAARDAS